MKLSNVAVVVHAMCSRGVMSAATTYAGCESFPGFGSARDEVEFASNRFNITTHDFIYSRSCSNVSKADLIWGHSGSFVKSALSNDSSIFAFTRDEVWLKALTRSGQVFGRLLCPHVTLPLGQRTTVPLERIMTLCASVTFNNCEVRAHRCACT